MAQQKQKIDENEVLDHLKKLHEEQNNNMKEYQMEQKSFFENYQAEEKLNLLKKIEK